MKVNENQRNVIARRSIFPSSLFRLEAVIILLGFILIATDLSLMFFVYKEFKVTTIITSSIFLLIILFCTFQLLSYLLSNKAGEEAIIAIKDEFYLYLPKEKEIVIKKEDMIQIETSRNIFSIFIKNKKTGSLKITYKEETKTKKVTIPYIDQYIEAKEKIQKIIHTK